MSSKPYSSHCLLALLAFFSLALTFIGCVEAEPLGRTPDLDFLSVLPTSGTLEVGDKLLLGASDLEGGVETNATSTVRWESDDEAVVKISYTAEDGAVVEAVGFGTANVTASAAGKRASAAFEVIANAASIELDKGLFELAKGSSWALGATLIAMDGKKRELGGETSWGTSNAEVATVDAGGLIRAVDVGDATITVTRKGLTASQLVHVRDFSLEQVEAQPLGGTTLPVNQRTPVVITGMFTDDHTQRIDSLFTLSVEQPEDAEEPPAVSVEDGVVIAGAAKGEATVSGTGNAGSIAEGQSFSLSFSVVETPLSELSLELPTILPVGDEVSVSVLGRFGDSIELATSAPLTAEPAEGVAINNSTSTVTGIEAGAVTLKATVILEDDDDDPTTGETIEGVHELEVVDADVSALALTPASDQDAPEIAVAATSSLRAEATFGAAGSVDVTGPAVWSSSAENIAVVSNVRAGRVTGLAAGTATISARYRGASAEFVVTVTP